MAVTLANFGLLSYLVLNVLKSAIMYLHYGLMINKQNVILKKKNLLRVYARRYFFYGVNAVVLLRNAS